jgi:hypothetical protein
VHNQKKHDKGIPENSTRRHIGSLFFVQDVLIYRDQRPTVITVLCQLIIGVQTVSLVSPLCAIKKVSRFSSSKVLGQVHVDHHMTIMRKFQGYTNIKKRPLEMQIFSKP